MSQPAVSHVGVILAAGRGRRMGRTKQLVPWRTADGEKPLVAAAYDAISVVCGQMIVVLGHEAELVADALAPRPFHRVVSDPDGEMFDSIRAGLVAANAISPAATIILQPGDHPQVAAVTLAALLAAQARQPEQAVLPQFRRHGGHPVLIPAKVAARLLSEACPGGLAQFWMEHPELCHRVVVEDPTVIQDVDTPSQLPG